MIDFEANKFYQLFVNAWFYIALMIHFGFRVLKRVLWNKIAREGEPKHTI